MLSADLVVCQLSVVKPVGQSVGRLYLTRFQSRSAPLVLCLPGYETAEVPMGYSVFPYSILAQPAEQFI